MKSMLPTEKSSLRYLVKFFTIGSNPLLLGWAVALMFKHPSHPGVPTQSWKAAIMKLTLSQRLPIYEMNNFNKNMMIAIFIWLYLPSLTANGTSRSPDANLFLRNSFARRYSLNVGADVAGGDVGDAGVVDSDMPSWSWSKQQWNEWERNINYYTKHANFPATKLNQN